MRAYQRKNCLHMMAMGIVILACEPDVALIQAVNTPDEVVDHFLAALDALDVEGIMATQAEDATMFFPHPNATFRVDGAARIAVQMDSAFQVARESAHAAGITSPPFLGVVANARNRRVQGIGDRGAVVSWVVDRPGNFGRRTATLRLDGDGVWRMVNFHSSNLRSANTN